MHRFTTQLATGAIVALVAVVTPCMADEAPAAKASPSAASSDIKVVRDKETGLLRAPTQEEEKELAAAGARMPSAGPKTVQLKTSTDGTKSAVLPESYMTTLTAVRDPDGNVTLVHSDRALDSAPAAREEK